MKGQTHVPHTSSLMRCRPPPQVQIKLSGSIISSTRIQWRAGLDVFVSQHGRQAVYIDPFQWVIYGGFSIN